MDEISLLGTGLVSAVAAVSGATIGSALTVFLGRAQAEVTVGRLQLVKQAAEENATVKPSPVIIERLKLSYAEPEGEVNPNRAKEQEYIDYLAANRDALDDFLAQMQDVATHAAKFRDLAVARDFDKLDRQHVLQQHVMWHTFEGSVARGRRVEGLDGWTWPQTKDYPSSMGTDEDGDFLVDTQVGAMLVFDFSHRQGPLRKKVQELAAKVSYAFATHDADVLISYFTFVRDSAPATIEATEALIALLEQELLKYQRLAVSILATNIGRTSWSLSPTATLTINSKGYQNTPGEQSVAVLPEKIALDLSLRVTPNQIPGAAQIVDRAVNATFVSDKTLEALPNSEVLLKMLNGAERTATLTTYAIIPGKAGITSQSTKPFPFRAFERRAQTSRQDH